MLTELYRQLYSRLTEAGFTIVAEDAVPPDAAFPFVTLKVEPPVRMQGSGSVVLTAWHRGSCRHRDRLAMADALLRFFPGAGLKFRLDGGLAVLHRADRQSVEWPEDKGALGVRIRLALRIYGEGNTEVIP